MPNRGPSGNWRLSLALDGAGRALADATASAKASIANVTLMLDVAARLRTAQREACAKPGARACRDAKDCITKQQYFDNERACIDARLAVMYMCFAGGDGAHWNEVTNRLNGLHRCLCDLKPGLCTN